MDESRLAISTCWCSSRHVDGYDMICELHDLGFSQVELSHGIRVSLVPGILRALEEGGVSFSSLHNFCPLPSTVEGAAPNLFQPSSRNKRELSSWRRYTDQTFDFAEKVGSRTVVMHSGSVRFRFSSPAEAIEMGEGKKKDAALRRLQRSASRVWPRVIEAYQYAAVRAAEQGLRMGIENREGLLEFPLDDDLPEFLEALDGDVFGYWHDTGHAQIKEELGLLNHEQHLEGMADRLLGFHLHDVDSQGHDHQVPGSGTVDFSMIARYVRPNHILVLEPSPRLTSEQIRDSRNYLLDRIPS